LKGVLARLARLAAIPVHFTDLGSFQPGSRRAVLDHLAIGKADDLESANLTGMRLHRKKKKSGSDADKLFHPFPPVR
jgi:hypothetical protein